MKLNVSNGNAEVIGILSMNVGCTSVIPNIHVRVSKYVPWIRKNMEKFVDPCIDIKPEDINSVAGSAIGPCMLPVDSL